MTYDITLPPRGQKLQPVASYSHQVRSIYFGEALLGTYPTQLEEVNHRDPATFINGTDV